MTRNAICLVSLLVLVGCSTKFDVRKIDPGDTTTPGVRYALPRPVLVVTPNADGSLAVEVDYVPDERNTYAIDACTTFAKHKLDVIVARGMLTEITYNPDSTAVAGQVVTSASGAIQKQVEADAKRKAERETQAETRRKETETKRAALEKALDDATQNVAKLRAQLAAMQLHGSLPDKILAKRIEIAAAESTLGFAQQAHDDFLRELGGGDLGPDTPGGQPIEGGSAGASDHGNPPSWLEVNSYYARGPMIYEIVDINDKVSLKPTTWKAFRGEAEFDLDSQPLLPTSKLETIAPSPGAYAVGGDPQRIPSRSGIQAAEAALARGVDFLAKLSEKDENAPDDAGVAKSEISKAKVRIAELRLAVEDAKRALVRFHANRALTDLVSAYVTVPPDVHGAPGWVKRFYLESPATFVVELDEDRLAASPEDRTHTLHVDYRYRTGRWIDGAPEIVTRTASVHFLRMRQGTEGAR